MGSINSGLYFYNFYNSILVSYSHIEEKGTRRHTKNNTSKSHDKRVLVDVSYPEESKGINVGLCHQ